MFNLYYGEKLVFIHEYYNACIGQAKYFFKHKNMNEKQFCIIDTENHIKHYVNVELLRGE